MLCGTLIFCTSDLEVLL